LRISSAFSPSTGRGFTGNTDVVPAGHFLFRGVFNFDYSDCTVVEVGSQVLLLTWLRAVRIARSDADRTEGVVVMSVVRLLVLGVVRKYGRAHGYAVRRELLSWRAETWTEVKPGSIYHALRQLTKEEKIREAGTEESGKGPGRTLYELTGKGEAEFRELLEAALSSFRLEELGAGVAFVQALSRRRAIELLKAQHRRAKETSDGLQGLVPNFPHRDEPPHTRDLLALWSGAIAVTASWTEGLIRHLESGGYFMADDEGADRLETPR
jgi:DNA-binding PadR family transcriptional regulator